MIIGSGDSAQSSRGYGAFSDARIPVSIVYFSLCFSVYFALPVGSPARWAIYFTLPIIFIELLLRRTLFVSTPTFFVLVGYVVLSMLGSQFGIWDRSYMLNFVVLASAISLFCFRVHVTHREMHWLAISAFFATVAVFLTGGTRALSVDFLASKGLVEFSGGLSTGLLAIYFWHARDRLFFFLTAAVFFANFKRIALVALFVALIVQVLLQYLPSLRRWANLISLSAFASSLFVGIYFASFLDMLATWFDLGNLNILSAGRYNVFEIYTWRTLSDFSPYEWVFGLGPGGADRALGGLGQLADQFSRLLHNDWLRILSDYGFIGTAFSVPILAILFSRRWEYLPFGVYFALILITDNVAIYFYFWVVMFFSLAAISSNQRTET